MNFYQWLQSLDPTKEWDYKNGIKKLEDQVCQVIAETGYMNLQAIFNQFFETEDSGLPYDPPDGGSWLPFSGHLGQAYNSGDEAGKRGAPIENAQYYRFFSEAQKSAWELGWDHGFRSIR